jgi:peptidoglycan hydrolase CwlO-like protein
MRKLQEALIKEQQNSADTFKSLNDCEKKLEVETTKFSESFRLLEAKKGDLEKHVSCLQENLHRADVMIAELTTYKEEMETKEAQLTEMTKTLEEKILGQRGVLEEENQKVENERKLREKDRRLL